jgi:hypothetical protein
MANLGLPTTLPPGWQQVRLLPKSDEIRAQVDAILGQVPADKHVATVAVADLFGARLATMVRLGNNWTFNGYVGREWGGKLEAGAELRWMA